MLSIIKNRYLRLALFSSLLTLSQLAAQSHGDCSTAYIICDKNTPVQINEINGFGEDDQEIMRSKCAEYPFPETNSIWFSWEIEKSGSLGFTLIPFDEKDDIDFILYKTESGSSACAARKELRCTYAGTVQNNSTDRSYQYCTGATGLREQSKESFKGLGCESEADKFLSNVDVKKGEHYLLFVNNFMSPKGFLLEFTGNSSFRKIPGECAPIHNSLLTNTKGSTIKSTALYPNPTNSLVNVDLETIQDAVGSMEIIDVSGRLIETQKISVTKGLNHLESNVEQLASGIYFIKIKLDGESYIGRFVKS